MKRTWMLGMLLSALLLSVSPLSAASDAPVIKRGIDVFSTPANGKTFYDFAQNPIPAGFFCERSEAFTGRVSMRGLPLETALPGQLRGADTVVERLDDAAFDRNGVAMTRVKLRALSLVSIEPIRTACGAFHVYASLTGKQRETTMRIYRGSERGGTFNVPLDFSVRLTFVPVKGKSSRKLQLEGNVSFPDKDIPWSLEGGPGMKRITGDIIVDTNGDLKPDTRVPGTSNFAIGWSPDKIKSIAAGSCTLCEPEWCHEDPSEQHCSGPVYACYPNNCP